MFASFQKKYFLSDKGVAGVKRGIFWTTLTNLITMAGMGFLFLAAVLLHLLHLLRGVRQAAYGDRRALAQTAAVVFWSS